jgi:monolysocardiolipin acyltransferase
MAERYTQKFSMMKKHHWLDWTQDLSKGPNLLTRTLMMGIFGSLSRLAMHGANDFKLVGESEQKLHDWTQQRRACDGGTGRPLISVSNHASTFDDPLLWGMLPHRVLWRPLLMRWTLSAEEVCFTNPFTRWFFASGQGIAIRRGAGLRQRGVDLAIERLVGADWVHIFSEGRVNQTERLLAPLRWGVGKMIAASTVRRRQGSGPAVLPFYHSGMEQVAPLDPLRIGHPRFGKRIRLLVGDAIFFDDIVDEFVRASQHVRNIDRALFFADDTDDELDLYARLTARVEQQLVNLERRLCFSIEHE